MDYGPFISSSVSMHPPKDVETCKGVTTKAITVKVGNNAAVCFDTNMVRYAGGWTGGWLKLMGTPFDGTHRPPEGSRPAPIGTYVLETATNTPGWGKPGSGSFDDPRDEPYLPMPADWVKWRGIYIHGDHVVLSYTVGSCAVLESPWYDSNGAAGSFTRTFKIAPNDQAMEMLAADEKGELTTVADQTTVSVGKLLAGVDGAPAGTKWGKKGDHLVLEIPPHQADIRIKVVMGLAPVNGAAGAPYEADKGVVDVDQFTHGAPPRFPQTIETTGALGTGDGSYVVDTLTLPDNNPWHSWMRVGGFDFFPDGKHAAVCTWSGDVWLVSGIDEKLDHLIWKRYATGLFQPLGMKIVDGQIYVLGRDQVTILRDPDGIGEATFYENFNNDISVTPNFHEFVFDLQQAPDGSFFFTKGSPLLGTDFFDPIGRHNGCVLHLSKDGKNLEVFATGLRAPNGTGMGPHGEVTCSDNQGIWTPVDRVNLVKKGMFLGCMGSAHRDPPPTDYDKPLFWVPYPEPDNSGGGQAWVTSDKWGPFQGDMLFTSYGKCRLFHVLQEEVEGQAQGGIVLFPLKFSTGIMRARFDPVDGQLYVGGLRGWQTTGGHDGALQRVRYTGKTVRDVKALHITPSGVDITFTVPLDRESATDTQNYSAQWWNYRWTKKYGSDEYKVSDPNQVGRDTLDIKTAALSADGKTVSLGIAGLHQVMQMAIKFRVDAADKTPIELEIDHTINKVPGK